MTMQLKAEKLLLGKNYWLLIDVTRGDHSPSNFQNPMKN